MTNNKIKIFSVLLLFQCLLFFMTRGEKAGKVFDKTKKLISVDFSSVDRFSLSTSEKENLSFVKESSGWSVPGHFNFPADEKKIQAFFSELKELKQSWPAGKTLISAKQFSVTADNHDKRIDFYKGEEVLGTLYIGSSPRFKKVHMRVEGESNTYVANFSSFEYQLKAESWLNRDLYKVSKESLKELNIGTLSILAGENKGEFTLASLKVNEESVSLKLNQVLNNVVNPNFKSILANGSYKTGKKVLSYSLSLNDGSKKTFNFFEAQKPESSVEKGAKSVGETDQQLVLKVSGLPYAFEVLKSEVVDLIGLKREDFVRVKEASIKKDVELKAKTN